MDPRDKVEIDRLAELTNVGAGHAAGAFAQLIGRPIWIEVPVVMEGHSDRVREEGDSPLDSPVDASLDSTDEMDRWCTGVFFEFEGCLDALVGILFPKAASEVLVRRIVGIETGEISPSLIESALMEVGNILASHVASAIADTLGARLLPSIPLLAMQDAEQAFSSWVEERSGSGGLRIESVLHDEGFEIRGRLVMVPSSISRTD